MKYVSEIVSRDYDRIIDAFVRASGASEAPQIFGARTDVKRMVWNVALAEMALAMKIASLSKSETKAGMHAEILAGGDIDPRISEMVVDETFELREADRFFMEFEEE